MSVELYGIDLNSDMVSFEQNSEVYGVNISESEVRTSVSASETVTADGPVCESLERESVVEFVESGSVRNMSDVSIPVTDVVEGRGGFAGSEIAANGDGDVNEYKIPSSGDLLPKEDRNVASYVHGLLTGDELGISVREVETAVGKDENGVVSVCDSEVGDKHNAGETTRINLIVDLNPSFGEGEDKPTSNQTSNERIEVNKFSGNVEYIPFSTSFSDNAAHFVNGFDLNGNQDRENIEHVTDIKRQQDIEKNNAISDVLKAGCYENGHRNERKGEFNVPDLVWGKVRSHPWWPGQIFDPLVSSEKARKYYKKNRFLIAYFGDQTFAWNEASQIKPFQMLFFQMAKQSNSEAFCHALSCALDEVSRRVEFGLACSCLSEEVYAKIKFQIIVNAGIREESSRRDGGVEFSSTDSFEPLNLVQYLRTLAQSPNGETDRLKFVISRAQILSFNRWKGYYQLPEFTMLNAPLEEGADISVSGKREDSGEVASDAVLGSQYDEQVLSRKRESVGDDNPSRKRKRIREDVLHSVKKERRASDFISGSHTKIPKDENEAVKKANQNSTPSCSGKKRKAVDSTSDDLGLINRKSVSLGTSKPFLRIGDSISKVARQLAVSTPILKCSSEKNVGEKVSKKKHSKSSSGDRPRNSEKSRGRKAIPVEFSSDEMLSHLCLVAKNPMKGYSSLISIVTLFSDFRNSFCLENSNPWKGKKPFFFETTETSEFKGGEGSYWNDRTVQSNPEEQVLFKSETADGNNSPATEPEAACESSPGSDFKQEISVRDHESEAGKPTGNMDKKCEQDYIPSALILNFKDLDSVPSETDLNSIFNRYGPLNESETEVLKKSNRARVVFKRRSDAETAFSSAGKFSIFGPSLVSYRLKYSPSPRKTPTSAAKGSRKDASSGEGDVV